MFGSFDNENKSFSIFLLIAVVVLAFFTQGSGFLRPWGSTRKKEEEELKDTITSEEIKVLFNRAVGKEEDLLQKRVTETIAEEPEDKHSVLYSRVLHPKRTKKTAKAEPEAESEAEPEAETETKHTVLYSRKVNNSLWKEKPYIPFYSRKIK